MYDIEDKAVAIVWVCLLPVTLALSVFAFLILCITRRKTVDVATSSAIFSRIVHCGGATLMATLFKLEHWKWSQAECKAVMWLWISGWTSDVLNSLFFLMFYSGRIIRKSPRSPCYVGCLFVISWALAVIAGGMPTIFPDVFTNHGNDICWVGLTGAEDPIPAAVIGILVLAFLLIIVLVISVITETQSKILIYWTSKKAEQRRETVKKERDPVEELTPSGDDYEQYWIEGNGSIPKAATSSSRDQVDNGSNSSSQSDSTPWIRGERSMKDIRNIMVTAGILSILFEIIPQMVIEGFLIF